ncbi:MAG TPA: phosphoadenylyl-sulfate reductase [Planctomycetota bacterium]|nr:phosphoadenylyl-sulfate reductase [Planctomycetota bacterium]
MYSPTTLQTGTDLKTLARELERKSAEEILRTALELYSPEIAFATAFGAEGMVVLDLLSKIEPRAKVFYVDTQFFFRPTYELIDRAKERYSHFDWIRILPELTPAQQAATHGPELYKSDPDACCQMRKVLPLKRYFEGSSLKAWVASLRREQSKTRTETPVVLRDPVYGLAKFHPLARWTWDEVWAYLRANDVPYNVLHDHQFPSIGCWPCTRAVKPGEDHRAGRWSGQNKTECGLHVAAAGGKVA